MVLDDGTVLTKCDQCQQMYAERTPPGSPPCENCRVVLREENEEVAKVFMMTRSQYVSLGERVVDISIPAVKVVMDMYQVINQKECLRRVMNLFYHFLSERAGNES